MTTQNEPVLGVMPVDALAERRAYAEVEARLFGRSPARVRVERYELGSRIASGGEGAVYTARDHSLDRDVAIKVLHGAAASGGRERLLREARAAASLTHPNVITIYDVGTFESRLAPDTESGNTETMVFVAMELIDGDDLGRWLHRERRGWEDVVRVMVSAGEGLAAAHEAGLVHRDFKPGNVLVATSGRVFVADFGLAEPVSRFDTDGADPPARPDRHPVAQATQPTSFRGTAAYMAPEQHLGEELDARSDQFAFCASLFESVYGCLPFVAGDLRSLIQAKQTGTLTPVPADRRVPAWLRKIIVRGLQADPRHRFGSMRALLRQLRRRHRVGPRAVWMAVGLAVVIVGGVAGSMDPPPAAPCGAVVTRFNEAWWEVDRAAVQRALTRSGQPNAERRTVLQRLDAFVQGWSRERAAACEVAVATQSAPAESASDAQLGCLQIQQVEFDAVADLLRDADDKVAARARALAVALPNPTHCQDASPQRGAVPPVPVEIRERVDTIRAELTRAAVAKRAGRTHVYVARAAAQLPAARELGYEPLLAEVLGAQAGDAAIRKLDAASADLRESVQLAQRSGHWEQELKSLTTQIFVLTLSRQHDEAAELVPVAVAVFLQLGRPSDLEWNLTRTIGILHWGRGEYAQALRWYELALRAAQDHGVNNALSAMTLLDMANAARGLGRVEASLRFQEEACSHSDLAHAEAPAERARYHNGLAMARFLRGDDDDAERAWYFALSLAETAGVAGRDSAMRALVGLAGLHHARGQHVLRLEEMRRALRLARVTFDSGNPTRTAVLQGLGHAAVAAGRPTEALRVGARALQLARSQDEALLIVGALFLQGKALLMLGRVDEARTKWGEALGVAEPLEQRLPRPDVAALRRAVAAVVAAQDPAEAERLRRLARGVEIPRSRPDLTDLDALVARHAG